MPASTIAKSIVLQTKELHPIHGHKWSKTPCDSVKLEWWRFDKWYTYIWLVRLSSEDTAVSTQLNLVCECERGHYNCNISRRIQLGFSQYSKVKTDHFTCAVFREYWKGQHISTVLLSRKVSQPICRIWNVLNELCMRVCKLCLTRKSCPLGELNLYVGKLKATNLG